MEPQEKNSKYVLTYSIDDFSPRINIASFSDNICTFGHEIMHLRQLTHAEKGIRDVSTLLYSLENFLTDNVYGYYKKYYDTLYTESEAEVAGN